MIINKITYMQEYNILTKTVVKTILKNLKLHLLILTLV